VVNRFGWDNIKRIDGINTNVAKFVFTKEDAVAEAVLYKYPTYEERTVICCSTQSGCPIGCRFCGAGDAFVRSLTWEEIATQPKYLLKEAGFSSKEEIASIKRLQIMFMSMGEPLLNLKNMEIVLHILWNEYPNARLLISTSAPRVDYNKVRDISVKYDTVGLQFSIHKSTDEERNKLIPFKEKLTLNEIADEGELWYEVTGRRPFFNYCVDDTNNTDNDALRLFGLFNPRIWEATLSVVCERNDGLPATSEYQRNLAADFAQKLLGHGFNTRVFDPAGQDDIGGGCGQLWFVQDWFAKHQDKVKPSIGSHFPVVHAPIEAKHG